MWAVALFLVALAAGVLAGVVVADRLGIPAPLLLIAAGVAASFLPFVPQVHLEPEVVLFGLLPPLLYSTAIQSSLVDFNAHRRSILLLSVGLVALHDRSGVGWLVHEMLPASPGRSRSRWARSSRRPMRSRRRRSAATSGCRDGS